MNNCTNKHTSITENQCSNLLYGVIGYLSWIGFPASKIYNGCYRSYHNCNKLRVKTKRRIQASGTNKKRQGCVATIMMLFTSSSNHQSLAFSLTDRSIKQQQNQQQRILWLTSGTTKSLPTLERSTEIRYPFSLVIMNQSSNERGELSDYEENNNDKRNKNKNDIAKLKRSLTKRIIRLEDIVSRQEVEIYRLKNTCAELSDTAEAFTTLLKLLREVGLDADSLNTVDRGYNALVEKKQRTNSTSETNQNRSQDSSGKHPPLIESFDDAMIFGTAPSSVIDAADSAGAAILAAMLGGKQRMLVDVRDAELSSDPETLVQFIELSILPIAAGLEGLKSTRNRVKIVFPKVSQLLEYRRTMALAAPEVVALSTLGFDPIEKSDKLVVMIAPEPDDEEGLRAIKDLLTPSEEGMLPIQKPVVILNYHMLPFSGVNLEFETAYHLRLLSVQYMADREVERLKKDGNITKNENVEKDAIDNEENDSDDEALESAMKHAHEVGVNEGTTRAMVIRAYPRPWHVFVDLSPGTDSDFEVAATFDKEPTIDEINLAIVECLEGSEREDEIVAHQMQQALEDGQHNQVSDMMSEIIDSHNVDDNEDDDTLIDDRDEDDFDMFEEDSV